MSLHKDVSLLILWYTICDLLWINHPYAANGQN